MKTNYIDLGLPSGRLWAAENAVINGKTYFNFDEAVEAFGDMLPSIKAWQELFKKCDRTWDKKRKGVVLTGPNGNSIFVPEAGFKNTNGNGFYWSSSPYGYGIDIYRLAYFTSGLIDPQDYEDSHDLLGFSVRLCKS